MDIKYDKIDKIEIVISYILKVLLFSLIIIEGFKKQWLTMFVSIIVFIISWLPSFIEKNYKIHLPVEFDFFFTLFLWASFALGEVSNFYQQYLFFDKVLHFNSGILLGLLGFFIIYTLYYLRKIEFNYIIMGIFIFSFSVMLGTIWEMFEFFMDHQFGLMMQGSLWDTMWDLIIDSIGAIIVAILGTIYVKRKRKFFLIDRLIVKFISFNHKHHWFKKFMNAPKLLKKKL